MLCRWSRWPAAHSMPEKKSISLNGLTDWSARLIFCRQPACLMQVYQFIFTQHEGRRVMQCVCSRVFSLPPVSAFIEAINGRGIPHNVTNIFHLHWHIWKAASKLLCCTRRSVTQRPRTGSDPFQIKELTQSQCLRLISDSALVDLSFWKIM